jgi:hypothetical protein
VNHKILGGLDEVGEKGGSWGKHGKKEMHKKSWKDFPKKGHRLEV